MTDVVLEKLCAIIARYGRSICEDPKRLRSMLSDYCPDLKVECHLIIVAMEHRIVSEILNSSKALPWGVISGRLVHRMVDELAITESAAQWTVGVWGVALGRVKPPEAIPIEKVEAPAPRPVVGKRPSWVYLIGIIYLLLLASLMLLPLIVALFVGPSDRFAAFIMTSLCIALLLLIGASLLFIPVGAHWERSMLRKSIVLPLFVSASCASALFAGAGFATHELIFGSKATPAGEIAGVILFVALIIVWTLWLVVFGIMAASIDRLTLSDRMNTWLLVGSVLELLIAVPMHLIVRRRQECCAGQATGFGIGVGVVVMFLALGPAVFFLFFRRYKQVYAKRAIRRTADSPVSKKAKK